jgi:hypothetical protein
MFGANYAPILRQDYHYLQTDKNEFPLQPRHLAVPSDASKMISKPMVLWRKPCTYHASTLTLSPNGPKWDSSSIWCVHNNFWALVCSAQNVHLSCVKISTISKWTQTSFHLSLVTYEYHWCIQNDFWAFGTLAQIVHLSCTYTNTISKWTEMRFHIPTHLGVPSGAFKTISSLWYVRCKPCTYCASRLALSPNGPKRVSTWALSPRSTIGCT